MDMEETKAKKCGFNSGSIDNLPQSFSNGAEESHSRSQTMTIYCPASISSLDVSQSPKIVFDDKTVVSVGINGQQNVLHNGEAKNGDSNTTRPTKHFRNFSRRLLSSVSFANGFLKLSPRPESFDDRCYDTFKTWPRNLERKITNLHGKMTEHNDLNSSQEIGAESLPPLDRHLDALEGPELDTLRETEELVLPEDKTWPFLLRFPISSFGICLGVSSQAMLWKTLALSSSMSFLSISLKVNLVLWYIALGKFSFVAFVYLLKIIVYFEAVRREYYHPVRINFFFAPCIACLFLAIGLPPHVAKSTPEILWYVLMAPIFALDLKIYGQWMSGGERKLSKVANPSNHLAVVGNFVGALLGANIGLKEGPIFFFAVGLVHYTVLFVTLYQRLPTNDTLTKELHPVFFLFIATPSAACTAWAKISGEFGIGARIPYFIAMFLYTSLVVRINFFRGFRFSLAWWAYTFPMAGAAIATIRYADQVKNLSSKTLALTLSTISTFAASVLLIKTILHAFVFKNLFPNDIAIAISHERSKWKSKRLPFASLDLEACKTPIK